MLHSCLELAQLLSIIIILLFVLFGSCYIKTGLRIHGIAEGDDVKV